jgi:hypothetical protein
VLKEVEVDLSTFHYEKRVLEIEFERHLKECGPTIKNSCEALTNAQLKMRRNKLLFRQVGNLKRQNFSSRK